MNTAKRIEKVIVKAIGLAGCIFLTVFAGLFGFISLGLLVMSIINCDLLDVAGCIAFACAGYWCWSLRREALV